MALRFLADHCIPNSTVQSLREANHEVLRLKDVLPVESSDTIVITKAQEIDAILLSLNGDFSHIIISSTIHPRTTKELSRCSNPCGTILTCLDLRIRRGAQNQVGYVGDDAFKGGPGCT